MITYVALHLSVFSWLMSRMKQGCSEGVALAENQGSVAESGADADLLLVDVVQAVIDRLRGGEGWDVQPSEFWCRVKPPRDVDRGQGWKLHISATPQSAPLVLARAAKVLVRHNCAFKFAQDLDRLETLLSRNCPRGSGGKFITAYPRDNEQFKLLAEELDRLTDGLPGPRILSDGQLRPGSLVHYRYGVFSANPVFTNEGWFESVLTAPDGSHVKDERLAWFSPPSWAECPLPEPAPVRSAPESVRLAERFVVRKAIKHSYGGGVYLAHDEETDSDVVLKQARQYTGGRIYGTDAVDALRHESRMLDLIAPLGVAPRMIALFEEQGDLFLAEEFIPGVGLRHWVSDQIRESLKGTGLPLAEVVSIGKQLVDLMATVHDLGLVMRDFNPNNIMVMPGNLLRIVDLEALTQPGRRGPRAYTPGYAPVELAEAPKWGPAPELSADLYALGATLFYLVTGTDPFMLPDDPAVRPWHVRLEGLVSSMAVENSSLRSMAPLILGLMDEDPDRRWSLDRARHFIVTVMDRPAPPATPGADRISVGQRRRLLDDGLAHVMRTVTPDSQRLWDTGGHGAEADPCAVQYGAAGVLAILTRAALLPGSGHDLRASVRSVADWIDQRRYDVPRLLPGLYFGRAGTAWALHDAARCLDDEGMAKRAIELAKRLPVPWPNPDICHGTAGAGLAHLHLWKETGDEELRDRALQCADFVLAARQEHDGNTVWPIPTDFKSALAGLTHYGFAHGVAGAGSYLLSAGLAFGRDDYLAAATAAGKTLERMADLENGAARWPSGEARDSGFQHWCSGASGIGTFLIRLWLTTGMQSHRDLAHCAAVTIRRNKWHVGTAACHGLAGDAEYLLDLANFTGEGLYRAWAEELGAALYARHAYRDGLMLVGSEDPLIVTADYNTGLGGVLGFLLRLQHGGPRWWMVDEPLHELGSDHVAGA
ncbi:class IV lanthionine synthetase LanL [Streptomyces wedmorensis]